MMVTEGLAENYATSIYGEEKLGPWVSKIHRDAGLPFCAGYACGYYLIKHYLKKTGKTIIEATLTPTSEILEAVEDFWKQAAQK